MDTLTFPSPWIGAGGATVPVQVYVPPGYNATTARYPTLYVVPWSYDAWARSVQVAAQLDALITSGSIPPQVVVFVPEAIGPYPVSGCADSANGRVWWDRYLTQTVVPRIDASYRTMTGAASRSVMGMSEGGYCAADILSRHPDMFGNAIAISGYYDAVPAAGHVGPVQTMFGTDPSRYPAWSPTSLVRSLRPAVRASVYFILIGRPAQAFYGQYFSDFGGELASSGTPCALLSDGIGHSWSEARAMLAPALEILAGHMAARGVFGG